MPDKDSSPGQDSDFETIAKLAMERGVHYRAVASDIPPRPKTPTDELRALFDVGMPEKGRPGREVIEALARAGEKGLMGNVHPNFHGWVQGGSHPVGTAADFLTAAWGQNAGMYLTAPAAAIAEEVVAKWLLDLLDLPRESSIGFSTGATSASFICLAAARSEVLRRAGYDLERDGMFGAPEIKVFLGAEAHSTIFAGLRYLGFGEDKLIRVDVDGQGRMSADDLGTKVRATDGPKIIIAQAGHINSGAFDPFTEVAGIAKAHNAWLHIDGAFGLWAHAVPELKHNAIGVDLADSWSVDGHKWLQVPYDSAFAIVKDEAAHLRAMDITASYLVRNPDDGRVPSQYVPELSRRARGFAVWATLQALGREGIHEMVLRHCRCAWHLRDRLEDQPGITVMNDVAINQVALSFGAPASIEEQNRLTQAVIDEIQRENKAYVGAAAWKGQGIARVSVISRTTDIEHMDLLADEIIRAWEKVSN